ncbi:hypothetical protein CDEST_08353 [Colletotrichum destructivum]|uniref:Uncharacterized protein n=1 Tax=Colletotrichum destructivum TaxID=34406 RepID=A0AAX4IJ72_9PEZI|nr:hypothetical protein CDEST_08353 [Colletotrichum destructivum]
MEDQLSQDGPTSPPWGWFPVEQFLIRRWDATSPLSVDEQRRTLLQSFMETDVLPDGWTAPGDSVSRVPTVEEVRDILAPWRPQKVRKIAHQYLGRGNQYIILRTYYGQDSDDKMAAILEDEEDGDESLDPEDNWWRVLDDAQLFDFGDDWQQIFEILPELVGHRGQQIHRGPSEAQIVSIRQEFAEFDQEDTLDQVSPIVDQIQKSAASGNGPLFVADEEALEEKLLQVFYLDGYGNVVRYSAIEPESMGDMKVREEVSRDVDCWSNGEIGHHYKRQGELAAKYYPQSG